MKPMLALLLAGASVSATAQSIDEFAFAVPMETGGGEAFYRVVVPQPVYEGAAFADLRDIRVFNGGDQLVPHAFRSIAPTLQKPADVSAPIFPLHGPKNARPENLELSVVRNGANTRVFVYAEFKEAVREKALLGYLVDASKVKSPLSGLRFAWGKAGAQQLTAVRIEASNDLRRWTTIVPDAPLGGLMHAGRRLERDTVEFNHQQADYLRITWLDPDRAIELAGVSGLVPEQWEQADRMWKDVTAQPDAEASGDYPFDLGGRFPVDRLEFRLPQENTVVPVQVLSRNDAKEKWGHVASAVAYRIRQDGRDVASPPLAIGPNPHRYWLLRVNMKAGGIGAGNVGVRAGWSPRELVFNARGNAPFRLVYGNPRAGANALSVETLIPGLRTDQEPKIALVATGAPQALAARQTPFLSGAERKKWGLWAALAAGVAVLAWMAWQLSSQMQKADRK